MNTILKPSLYQARHYGKAVRIGLVMLLVLILVGCGGGGAAPEAPATGATSYIATVQGAPASARVGLVLEGNRFVVYVCSLDDAFNLTSARWFEGELGEGNTMAGTSTDGVTLAATVQGDTFAGTIVNIEGTALAFTGTIVTGSGPAGLYRGFGQYGGEDIIVGAVVSADGSFASTVQYKGRFEFVTPIAAAPERLSDQSINVIMGSDSVKVPADLVLTLAADAGG